jgi:hypothetical protein
MSASGISQPPCGEVKANKPTVIYIASVSHSGSTLLDLMLNAHPDVISVGELKQLERYARQTSRHSPPQDIKRQLPCTCGAPSLWECPFWSRVNAHTAAAVGRNIGELNVETYKETESFAADNVALFEAIFATAGKRYIVDSSKYPKRLQRLLSNPAIDVFPIFLIRDPKGQICSTLDKTENGRGSSLRELMAQYVDMNRWIYQLVKQRPHARVHYEELVQHPERTLSDLMQRIGLAFHPMQLNWGTQECHNVNGNHMRFDRTNVLKLDDRWRERLTFAQRIAIDAATIPGRYPFIKWGFRRRPRKRSAGRYAVGCRGAIRPSS